jgi:hypothetical protein
MLAVLTTTFGIATVVEGFFSFTDLNSTAASIIRIAHLQPNEPTIQHEPHVLKMCSKDLKERGILPADIGLQYEFLKITSALSHRDLDGLVT